ncbi:uncharacterized protein Dana_GF10982 [Drosophila ananassae]|uniref:Uncharacterized protein n=1 Tax=Drosophila ananassae TaxID=7217 RepID=B3MB56_DROAN|nr:uncharacterized protein LOC6493848 [Drosophila ananassae]EDV41357.2 uncharacterized protein Dana_GF10982 [Drosophila ananassae]
MQSLAAINLFLYNSLVCYLVTHIKRTIETSNVDFSFWQLVPIASYILASPQAVDETRKINEVPWKINFYLNFLLLLPAMIQRRHFKLLVGAILICNIYVFERLVVFFGYLLWVLWRSDMNSTHYATLAFCGVFMNAVHLAAISGTLKWQSRCLWKECLSQMQTPVPKVPKKFRKAKTIKIIGDGAVL